MVDSICKELKIKSLHYKTPIQTLYFGGGTPSLLTHEQLAYIYICISSNYELALEEVTLEANPDDITEEKLKSWLSIGVNRLSIGIQSFDPDALSYMNRCHTTQEATKSVEMAQTFGFKNISLDLIFGIPDFDDQVVFDDLEKLIALKPQHISCYGMTIEEKTVFGRRYKKGELTPCSEENAATLYSHICKRLAQEGFVQYEISNFGVPNYFSKHNMAYWQSKDFVGIGPSAHSFDGENRTINIANNPKYILAINNKTTYFETEILTTENKINEHLMTRLRTMWGIDCTIFETLFGADKLVQLQAQTEKWIKSKDIIRNENCIKLTQKGKLFADSICEDLFW